MRNRKRKRLILISGAMAVLALAIGLVLIAFSQDIRYFRTPDDVTAEDIASGARFRLGGLVEAGSVVRGADKNVQFAVTDTLKQVTVTYEGILPDLFREGQGVVAEGRFTPDGVFIADNVLAKHDENYMPKDVADSLKEKGVWEGN
ncbi:cytochrome c maturation protein CcmE [Ochrobactrum sp. SFR4]|uniref:cytochrome c maturation protein CcmE n=1 Tax=Ochrobactrum sp. SFR4 TaxID=2717368 RepID=UPI001C8C04C5|nr:cytochrome c maturation protein CcmE [Ochrobactrum sp. SFR4]MBX8824570.1 cytochrome c maturation protein CcmE [Ochrobactrum sp. SFR4]